MKFGFTEARNNWFFLVVCMNKSINTEQLKLGK